MLWRAKLEYLAHIYTEWHTYTLSGSSETFQNKYVLKLFQFLNNNTLSPFTLELRTVPEPFQAQCKRSAESFPDRLKRQDQNG